VADVADCPLQRLSAVVIKNIIIIIIIISPFHSGINGQRSGFHLTQCSLNLHPKQAAHLKQQNLDVAIDCHVPFHHYSATGFY